MPLTNSLPDRLEEARALKQAERAFERSRTQLPEPADAARTVKDLRERVDQREAELAATAEILKAAEAEVAAPTLLLEAARGDRLDLEAQKAAALAEERTATLAGASPTTDPDAFDSQIAGASRKIGTLEAAVKAKTPPLAAAKADYMHAVDALNADRFHLARAVLVYEASRILLPAVAALRPLLEAVNGAARTPGTLGAVAGREVRRAQDQIVHALAPLDGRLARLT